MKGSTVLAAGAALLGGASAAGHKMKLQKIPLSEQLVRDLLEASSFVQLGVGAGH